MTDETFGKGDTAFVARTVRDEALRTEVLLDLQALLSRYEEAGKPATQGMYVDTRPSPPVRLKDEIRVSIARIVAITPLGHRLLGQIQTSAKSMHGELVWSFKFFLHSPEGFMTKELPQIDTWWVALLEAYYGIGGPTVDMKIEVIT